MKIKMDKLSENIRKHGYCIKRTISGYYRLEDKDGNIIYDDSACEDCYNFENAVYLFSEMIKNK